jgi:hypothetical protein
MIPIELNEEDRNTLRDILQRHLTELSWELAFTHKTDSIKFLQRRKEFIEGFIQRLDR